MTELALIERSNVIGTALPQSLVQRAERVHLDSNGEYMGPVLTAEQKERARGYLIALQRALEPATPEELAEELLVLSAHFAMPSMSKPVEARVWRDYAEDLADLPLAVLREACKACRNDTSLRRMPRPGQIRDHAAEPLTKARRLAWQLKTMIDHEPEPARRGPRAIPEAVRAYLDRHNHRQGAKD